jgi:enterochelin esterase-like enzyme
MRRVRGVRSELRVVNGRHDWDAWRPTFVEGVELAFRFLSHEGAGAEKR